MKTFPAVMDFSTRLKLERQKRSWTQEQLAERARISPRTVQRIENGMDASAETLRLIAEALGLAPEALRPVATRTQFGAPWGRFVMITTACTILLCLVPTLLLSLRSGSPGTLVWLSPFCIGLLISCFLLSVTGFTLREGRLLIHRIGWATSFDLATLAGFEANPHAMVGSIRLFGNGGLFAFIGWYRNPLLGVYRAYVTNPAHAVVLDFGGKKIVVSPDDPAAFVEALREASRGVCAK